MLLSNHPEKRRRRCAAISVETVQEGDFALCETCLPERPPRCQGLRSNMRPNGQSRRSYATASTGSSHSLLIAEGSPAGTMNARCENASPGAAPCQCLVSAGMHTARLEPLRLLPVDLVIATSAYCDEHLRATMMDMPMIAASRLEGYVVDGDFRGIKHRRQITLSNEILCETVIRIAHRKCTWIVHTPYSTPMQKECPMSVRHVLP